jgi:hypothetical protein
MIEASSTPNLRQDKLIEQLGSIPEEQPTSEHRKKWIEEIAEIKIYFG